MARVTVEDCLEQIPDQFALVHLSTQRYRQLHRGAKRLVPNKNKNIVSALREIAAGHVRYREPIRETLLKNKRKLISQRLQRLMDDDMPIAAAAEVELEDDATPLI